MEEATNLVEVMEVVIYLPTDLISKLNYFSRCVRS